MAESSIEFEWDEEKARINLSKHSISFEEAQTAFKDAFAYIIDDPDPSLDEHREILIGRSARQRLVFVSFTERAPFHIRLISARKADSEERAIYEENNRVS